MEPIYEQLKTQAHRFDFFQAVRLLEAHYQVPVGTSKEIVLFEPRPQLGFAVADILGVKLPSTPPATLTLSFMGLLSPQGLLPMHYTEQTLQLLQAKNMAFTDFLHLLAGRSLVFFYGAWRKYRCFQQNPKVTNLLDGLVGNGLTQQKNSTALPDYFYVHYAMHFMRSLPTSTGLTQVLSDYFNVPIHIKPCQGEWLTLSDEACSRLSQRNNAYNQLGVDMAIGRHVWQCQHKFRIIVGPLTIEKWEAFLPPGSALKILMQIVKRMVGSSLQFDIQLIIQARAVFDWQLGAPHQARLGWTSWLTQPSDRTAEHTLILQEKSYEHTKFSGIN